MDALTRHGDVPSVGTDANPTARSWKLLEYPKEAEAIKLTCWHWEMANRWGRWLWKPCRCGDYVHRVQTNHALGMTWIQLKVKHKTSACTQQSWNMSWRTQKCLQTKQRTLEHIERSWKHKTNKTCLELSDPSRPVNGERSELMMSTCTMECASCGIEDPESKFQLWTWGWMLEAWRWADCDIWGQDSWW